MKFDPEATRALAAQLDQRAAMVGPTYTLVAIAIGAAAAGAAGYTHGVVTFGKPNVTVVVSTAVLGAFVLGALAVYVARGVALALRTQAQQALCLLAIESNTQPRASA